jgi:RNA polymerase sigma-70 factor, ECF subfamily
MAEEREATPRVQVPSPFEVFYRNEYAPVVALMRALCRTTGVPEEIAQEAFLRAFRDWDRVSTLVAPQSWVRRVAINLAMSRFRRLRVATAVRLRLTPIRSSSEPLPEEDEAMWAEVRRLPPRQAQVVTLRYIEDLSVREIAEVLGIAEGTVRATLHQARDRLRQRLSEQGWVDDEA